MLLLGIGLLAGGAVASAAHDLLSFSATISRFFGVTMLLFVVGVPMRRMIQSPLRRPTLIFQILLFLGGLCLLVVSALVGLGLFGLLSA